MHLLPDATVFSVHTVVTGFYLRPPQLLKCSYLPGLLPWESGDSGQCAAFSQLSTPTLWFPVECFFSHWCESMCHRWGDTVEYHQPLTSEGGSSVAWHCFPSDGYSQHMTSPCWDQKQLLCGYVLCDPFLRNIFIDIWSVSFWADDSAQQAHWKPLFRLDFFVSCHVIENNLLRSMWQSVIRFFWKWRGQIPVAVILTR